MKCRLNFYVLQSCHNACLNLQNLMHSRQHEPEREPARLGCAHLAGRKAPCILKHFYPIIKRGSHRVTQGTKDTSISIPTSTRKNGSIPLDISSMESPLIAEPTNSE